ncbi:MAG: class I SAM-dependent methyltransferase [Verrucomicrobia bacterium]|nr:class I SAM-dependent methyltransferase [Verrucomicrobiota bacterium]
MIPQPSITRRILKSGFYKLYHPLSRLWRKLDHLASWKEVQFWIENVPDAIFTPATYNSYANWLHNQGFFAALLNLYLDKPTPRIFDFGCGMGNLAPVCHYFVRNGGNYLGVDVDAVSIDACHQTFKNLKNCSFYLTSDKNPYYPQSDPRRKGQAEIDWPVNNGTQDLVIAMSVFTHLQEKDALRYLEKILKVLGSDGLAIISFLVVRDYVNTNPVFNFTHPLTPGWFTSNPACPEMAIGVTQAALERLLTPRFSILKQIEGSATGGRKPCLQDIVILKKASSIT